MKHRKIKNLEYYTRYENAHPKARSKIQQHVFRCFAHDRPAGATAMQTGRSVRSINPTYQWLRGIIAQHYRDFLRFRRYDIDYELTLLLSQSAMMTMYRMQTERAEVWDGHTTLLRSHAGTDAQSRAELMRYTFEDEARMSRYDRHMKQNRDWLIDSFIRMRRKHLRTRMVDNEQHIIEGIYRFMITSHVLWHKGLDESIIKQIKGRHIGEGETLEKAGVVHIDPLFKHCAFDLYSDLKSRIIFSDLMDFLNRNPDI